jgi:hypothetical protein
VREITCFLTLPYRFSFLCQCWLWYEGNHCQDYYIKNRGTFSPLDACILPQNGLFFKTCHSLCYGVLNIEHHESREGMMIVWLSEKTDRIAQPVDSLLQPVKALAGIITRGICRSSLRSAES